MSDKKDYSEFTLEELVLEEKKVKKNEAFSAGLIGFMVGIMIYGIITKGFGFLYIAIPLFLIFLFYKNSQTQKQNLKQIQAEINARNLKQDR